MKVKQKISITVKFENLKRMNNIKFTASQKFFMILKANLFYPVLLSHLTANRGLDPFIPSICFRSMESIFSWIFQ